MIFKNTLRTLGIALVLCTLCAVGLSACGTDALKTTSNNTSTEQTIQTNSVGVKTADDKQGDTSAPEKSEESGLKASAAATESEPETAAPAQLGVSIVVDSANAGRGYFTSTYVTLWEGATVYDALCATGLPFDGNSGYISSINGLAEFDFGPGSGWTYTVNGSSPMLACGSYVLSSGDNVYWYYSI